MSLTVVIDGGGSGSRLAAFDKSGNKVAQVNSSPAGLSLGHGATWSAIESGLQDLATQLDRPADWMPEELWCGLAGSQQSANKTSLLEKFPANTTCHIINDGYAQLLGSCGGVTPAACLSIGTGSVLNHIDEQGQSSFQGGWGFPVGDEGSGAWIGIRAINRLTHWYDTRLKSLTPPPMIEALLTVVEPNVEGILEYSTCNSAKKLATLAPLVFDTVTQDQRALDIITEGAEHLHDLIAETSQTMPLYIAGGLALNYQPYLQKLLDHEIQRSPDDAALDGLYWYAKNSRKDK